MLRRWACLAGWMAWGCTPCAVDDATLTPVVEPWFGDVFPTLAAEVNAWHPQGVCVEEVGPTAAEDELLGRYATLTRTVELSSDLLVVPGELAHVWHHEVCHGVDRQRLLSMPPGRFPIRADDHPHYLALPGIDSEVKVRDEVFADICAHGPDHLRWVRAHLEACPGDAAPWWPEALEFVFKRVYTDTPTFTTDSRPLQREAVWTLEGGLDAPAESPLLTQTTTSCWSWVDDVQTSSCATLEGRHELWGSDLTPPGVPYDVVGRVDGLPLPPGVPMAVSVPAEGGRLVTAEVSLTPEYSLRLHGWTDGEALVPLVGMCGAQGALRALEVGGEVYLQSTSEDGYRAEYWRM